jgi:hypothetical protein
VPKEAISKEAISKEAILNAPNSLSAPSPLQKEIFGNAMRMPNVEKIHTKDPHNNNKC